MGRFTDPTSPNGSGRFRDPTDTRTDAEKSFKMSRRKKKEEPLWQKTIAVTIFIIAVYFLTASVYFETKHVKAGRGALIVHFWEVITFGDVPELKE